MDSGFTEVAQFIGYQMGWASNYANNCVYCIQPRQLFSIQASNRKLRFKRQGLPEQIAILLNPVILK